MSRLIRQIFSVSILMFLAAIAAVAEDGSRMPISGAAMVAIEKNDELAKRTFSKLAEFEFDYSEKSIKWVDGFINRNRRADPKTMVDVIGSYLGSAIAESFGGRWVEIDGKAAVELEEDVIAFPFSKVEKQFKNGEEDSILSFYKVIPVLIADRKAKKASNKTMEPTR